MRRLAASSTPLDGEIVEGLRRHFDDVFGDERRAFAGALFGALDAALPLQHRPAIVVVLGELREDAGEIDLTVAQRTEAAGAVHPALEAGVHALLSARKELRILDVKGEDALVVEIDELEIVQLLQHEMRRVVVDAAALVVADALEQHLERDAVHDVFAGVQLEGDVDADFVGIVEDGLPALGEFVERGLDQAGGTLRPRIDERPDERAGEGRHRLQAEVGAGLERRLHLVHRPLVAGGLVAAHRGRREAVEG